MEQYSFSVKINDLIYNVKSDFEDYEIWHDNKLLFILKPDVNNENRPRWRIKGPTMADIKLVEKLGEEIEKNCCS